ncbi:sugar phosphate nucleotidyltransferase, partial [Escherichia coli]|nr:sugar phosphate nucleotidyltransferase [Escherichia coli]
MKQVLLPVVMAGGSGTRLWPLSRALYPKQFLAIHGSRTLFQQAVERLMTLAGAEHELVGPCIVGNEEHRFLTLDQLREMRAQPSAVLLE